MPYRGSIMGLCAGQQSCILCTRLAGYLWAPRLMHLMIGGCATTRASLRFHSTKESSVPKKRTQSTSLLEARFSRAVRESSGTVCLKRSHCLRLSTQERADHARQFDSVACLSDAFFPLPGQRASREEEWCSVCRRAVWTKECHGQRMNRGGGRARNSTDLQK